MSNNSEQKRILFVANVGKEHICKFHIPTIRCFKDHGWIVDVACAGEEVIPICDHQYKMHWKRTPFSIATIKGLIELQRLLKSEFYDVIYCNTPVGGLEARIAAKTARKYGTRVVYCVHGFHFYKGAPLRNWIMYYPIEKYLAKYTDLILTVNTEDTNLIKRHFRGKVDVIQIPGIGVDFDRLNVDSIQAVRRTTREKYRIPASALVMIYVAEVLRNKNQRMLVDTLSILKKNIKDVYLFIVGPIHDGGELKEYVKNRNLSDYIFFTGWQDNISPFLYASDVCTASSFREGFGINLVEAMYCGLPVVATDNRGHRSIIINGKNGFLVPFSAKCMAERILQIASDSNCRLHYSNINVSKYDCNVVAKTIYSLIYKIIVV